MEGSLGSFSAPNSGRDKSHTHTNIHTRAFAPGNVVFCKSAAASHRSKLGKKELVAEFSPAVVLLGPVPSTPYMCWGGGVSWPRNHTAKTEQESSSSCVIAGRAGIKTGNIHARFPSPSQGDMGSLQEDTRDFLVLYGALRTYTPASLFFFQS